MASKQLQFEQRFFRALNSVVEPAVRRGIFSSRWLPTSLMVLESTGYVSGKTRSTPLFCNRIGPYLLLSTARGDRSFWVRNLQQEPAVNYFLGGRRYNAEALVITADSEFAEGEGFSLLRPLIAPLQALAGDDVVDHLDRFRPKLVQQPGAETPAPPMLMPRIRTRSRLMR